MATEIILKKWGNSVGAIFPKKLIEKENLKEKERILIDVVREADLRDVFGSLKRKMNGQEFKDMVREGWS
jgi:antitoxin component of MazEF toxin-antitoxin module